MILLASKKLPLRKTKGVCSKLMLVILFLVIVLTVTSNTWTSFSNNQYDLHLQLNSGALVRSGHNLHTYNVSPKLVEKQQNNSHIIDDNLDKKAGRTKKNDKSRNDKTIFVKNLAANENVVSEIITKPVGEKYRKVHLHSESRNKSILRATQDIDIEGDNPDYNEVKYDVSFDKLGDGKELNNRRHDDSNKSDVVVNRSWLLALRARTKNMGILRKQNLHWTIEKAGTYSKQLFTPPPGELPRQRFPRAIIVGIGHCGTRALIEFLKMHPHIVPSSSEIHFFDRDDNFMKGYGWYKAQMPLSYSNQVTVEKTPSYLWSERALHEIYKTNKKIKLIIIMKDPVNRLVSMKLSHHPELIKKMQIINVDGHLQVNYDSQALIHGVYVKFLKPWLQKYNPSQIHIIEGNEFTKDPAREIAKIESFLGVPHFLTKKNFYFNATKGFYCVRPLHVKQIVCLNDSKGRQHPKLKPVVEKMLYDYYRGYNEKLFKLLGRRFPWTS